MQRCPYIHEMRERLLNEQPQRESVPLEQMERANLLDNRQSADSNQVGTVVKVGAIYHTRTKDTLLECLKFFSFHLNKLRKKCQLKIFTF